MHRVMNLVSASNRQEGEVVEEAVAAVGGHLRRVVVVAEVAEVAAVLGHQRLLVEAEEEAAEAAAVEAGVGIQLLLCLGVEEEAEHLPGNRLPQEESVM